MTTLSPAATLLTTTRTKAYLPREHGATAMLLTPIVAMAILVRTWHWSELAVLTAAFAAISAKDPAVVLIRQRLLWKHRSPDATSAAQWLLGWTLLLTLSVLILFRTWPLTLFVIMGAGIALFAALAIFINFKNRQRSTLFQIASAAALTSTSIATCIAATGSVPTWSLWFWALTAAQASAGILVVHARLDARFALRKPSTPPSHQFRRAAFAALAVLFLAAIAALARNHALIACALLLVTAVYTLDLLRQSDAAFLQMPLKTVGQRALLLSTIYAALLIAGLW